MGGGGGGERGAYRALPQVFATQHAQSPRPGPGWYQITFYQQCRFSALDYISLKALLVDTLPLSCANLTAPFYHYGALEVSRLALEEDQLNPGGRFGSGTLSLKSPECRVKRAKLKFWNTRTPSCLAGPDLDYVSQRPQRPDITSLDVVARSLALLGPGRYQGEAEGEGSGNPGLDGACPEFQVFARWR